MGIDTSLLAIADNEIALKALTSPTLAELNAELGATISHEGAKHIFENLLDTIARYDDLSRTSSLCRYQVQKKYGTPDFPTELLSSSDYFSHLGLTLISHDFGSIMCGFSSNINNLTNPDRAEDVLRLLLTTHGVYDQIRLATAVIPYLATGDQKYNKDIESSSLDALIGDRFYRDVQEICWLTIHSRYDIDRLSSDKAWITLQLVKNARVANADSSYAEYKMDESKGTPKRDISISYVNNTLIVEDSGTGIDSQVMPLIFGTYTNGGTGLGLQVVKRLIDICGANIAVTSRIVDKNAYRYDLSSGNLQQVEWDKQGTKFEVHFRK